MPTAIVKRLYDEVNRRKSSSSSSSSSSSAAINSSPSKSEIQRKVTNLANAREKSFLRVTFVGGAESVIPITLASQKIVEGILFLANDGGDEELKSSLRQQPYGIDYKRPERTRKIPDKQVRVPVV